MKLRGGEELPALTFTALTLGARTPLGSPLAEC